MGASAARPSVDYLARVADARFASICARLGSCNSVGGPIEVWIAEDPERFSAAFPDGSPMAEWAAGVTFLGTRRVVLRAHGSALFSLSETFDHEVAHVLIHATARSHPVPRWLDEGLAIWLSGEDVIGRLDAAHRAALTHSLIPLDQLDRAFPDHGPRVALAYAESALFTRHLIERFGPHALPALLLTLGEGVPFARAFSRRFGDSPEALAEAWSASIEEESSLLMLLRDGNALWLLMTLLFLVAAWVHSRKRRAQLAALGDGDLADEAFAELKSRTEAGDAPTLH